MIFFHHIIKFSIGFHYQIAIFKLRKKLYYIVCIKFTCPHKKIEREQTNIGQKLWIKGLKTRIPAEENIQKIMRIPKHDLNYNQSLNKSNKCYKFVTNKVSLLRNHLSLRLRRKIWIRIFLDKPVILRFIEIRMGLRKGSHL